MAGKPARSVLPGPARLGSSTSTRSSSTNPTSPTRRPGNGAANPAEAEIAASGAVTPMTIYRNIRTDSPRTPASIG
jgi:hypothetical protein